MTKFSTLLVLALTLAVGACDSGAKTDTKTAQKQTDGKKAGAEKSDDAAKPGDDAAKPGDDAKAEDKKPSDAAAPPEPPPHILTVSHEVKDYEAWKAKFDEHESARAGAGVVWHGIAHDEGNQNSLLIGVIGSDPEKLKAFTESEDVTKAMKDAGVKGTPVSAQWTRVARTVHEKVEEGAVKAMVFSTASLEDFDKWKTAFDEGAKARKEGGIVSELVAQSSADENSVLVVLYGKEMDALKKFFDNPELKKRFKESGIKGEPKIRYMVPVNQKMYQPSKEG